MSQRSGARYVVSTAALAVAVLTTSCSAPFQPKASAARVDVDNVPTDIIFGVPSPSPVAAASGPTALVTVPPAILTLPEQPPSLTFVGNDITFPVVPAPAACPTASPTSFPPDVATSDVSKMPVSGAYRWATGGAYVKTIGTISVPIQVPMFEQRVVRNAKPFTDPVPTVPGSPPDYAFTYQTIEPVVTDGTALLLYWQVKANPVANDPEGGVVLKQVDTLDKSGKNTGTIFQGTPGLLMLPLPVAPGTSFNSTSVDTHANSLQLKGTVGNHERVDACGQPLQAWGVDATLQNAGASAANPAKLHFDVATQMGALMIAFNIDGAFFGTQYQKETARIGQVAADPVPDTYK